MGCLGFGKVSIADGKSASFEVDIAGLMRLLLHPEAFSQGLFMDKTWKFGQTLERS